MTPEKLAQLREVFDAAFHSAWDAGMPEEAYPRGLTAVYELGQIDNGLGETEEKHNPDCDVHQATLASEGPFGDPTVCPDDYSCNCIERYEREN